MISASESKCFLCHSAEISFQAGSASLVLAHALWTHAQDPGLSQAKLPNGPVNHMQRHEEAYASSCSVTTGCQGHNCSGCLTDWFGIRGLGLD